MVRRAALASVEPGRFTVRAHPGVRARLAEAVHPHVGQRAQVPGEVLHVDAGAAVDVRGVFAGEEVDAQGHVPQTSRSADRIRLAPARFDR